MTDRVLFLLSIYDSYRHDPATQRDIRREVQKLQRAKGQGGE